MLDRFHSRGGRAVVVVVATLFLAAFLTACGSDPQKFTGRRLDNPWAAPDIALTDTAGSPYSLAKDATEPLTLVFFGYTHCPDVCPMVMNNLAAAMNRLDEQDRDRTTVVFVTTDPKRDDPAELRAYLDGYDEGFEGLTGDLKQIMDLGEPLNVYVSDGKKLPTGGYDLGGHTTFVLGLRDGKVRVIWNEETSSVEYASDIHTLLNEG